MKKKPNTIKTCLLILLFLQIIGCQEAHKNQSQKSTDTLRVLFIGNSYTFYNNLPGVLSKMAASAEPALIIKTDRCTVGGHTLELHWNDGIAIEKIRQGNWDFVVLQDHSRGTLSDTKRQKMFDFAHKFDAEIKKAGAKTVFFMTWARRNEQPAIERIARSYETIAEELDAIVVPVGRAWQSSILNRPDLALHTEDNSHPTPHGTYLAACVFYATLTNQNPIGLSNTGLKMITNHDVGYLQKTAWETVKNK